MLVLAPKMPTLFDLINLRYTCYSVLICALNDCSSLQLQAGVCVCDAVVKKACATRRDYEFNYIASIYLFVG